MIRIPCSLLLLVACFAFGAIVHEPSGARGDDRLPGGADAAALVETLRSDDPVFEKAKACQRLAIIGDATAVPALSELLSHPQLAGYSRTALERIPGTEAEAALVDALATVQGNELIGVLHSIGQRRISSALSQLETLAETGDPAVRAAAGRSIRRIREADRSEPPREVATDTLGEMTVADRTRLAANLTSHPESKFRQAIDSARDSGAASAEVIADSLASLEAQRQVIALIALADLGNRRVIDAITPLLDAEDTEVAAWAFKALVDLGHYEGADSLPEIVDRRPELAPAILPALAQVGSEGLDRAVLQRLSAAASGQAERSEPMLLGLAGYAAKRYLDRATEPLLQLALSTEGELRSSLLIAAGATTTVDRLGGLLRVLESLVGTLDPETESSVIERALVRMPPDAAADVIGDLLEDFDVPRQQLMLQRLAFLGGDRALQIVADAARGSNETLVDGATQALGQWPTVDVADTLQRLVHEMPPSRYRIRLIRGYLRVIRQFDMPDEERVSRATELLEQCDREEERELVRDVLRRFR